MPEEIYEVEVILAVRGREKYKSPEYFVKWYGYPDSENSWEPPSSFKAGIRDLLKAVWVQIKEQEGLTRNDFAKSSLEVELDPLWIKQRTHYFYQVFKNGIVSSSPPVHTHSPNQPSLKRKRDQSEPAKQKPSSLVIKLPPAKAPESSSSKSVDSFLTEQTPDGSDMDTPLTRSPVCQKRISDPPKEVLPPSGHVVGNDLSNDDEDEHLSAIRHHPFLDRPVADVHGGPFSSGSDDTVRESSPRCHTFPDPAVEMNAPPNEITPSSLEEHLSFDKDDNDMMIEDARHNEGLSDPVWEGSVYLVSKNITRQNCGRVSMRFVCPRTTDLNTNSCLPQLQLTVERFYRLALVARLIQDVGVSVKMLGSLSGAPENANHLERLQQYMKHTRMVAASPRKTIGCRQIMWILFCSSMKDELGLGELDVPRTTLAVAAVEFGHPSRAPRARKSLCRPPSVLAAILTYTPTVDIRVRQYLRFVQFPEWLHRGIVAIQHALFYVTDTGNLALRSQIQQDFDALLNILSVYSHLQSSSTPLDATIIFMHFSTLGKPSRLPLRKLRKRRTPIFVGFGRTIRKNPKFAVLFRSGGLITFSPAVLCEEPLRILDIISRVRKMGGAWRVYVPTYILGAAFVQYKEYRWESNVVKAYTRGTFAFKWILDAVVARDLEMTFGLLHRRAPVYTCDTDLILRRCLDDYAESKTWFAMPEAAISKDMLLRQRSVSISAQFRRYVVLDIDQATRVEDEFEWLTCKEFVDSLEM